MRTGPEPPSGPQPDPQSDLQSDPQPDPPGGRRARRVVVDPEGPVLVEGPVEVGLPDGRTVRSDRFVVAVCACRRSRRYPWCDTSHRRRERRSREPDRDREQD